MIESASDAPDARDVAAARLALYVPRVLQENVSADLRPAHWTAEGTAAFVDIAGFTRLSEQLASKGREGAEQIADVVDRCFASILRVAYDAGASLLKFGGDALLLWYQGDRHLERACRSTIAMRDELAIVGRIELPGVDVTLQMSQGVHSGGFHFFAVDGSHVELLPCGPGWTRLVAMETEASAGEILLSTEAAASLPREQLGAPKGPGILLGNVPGAPETVPRRPRPVVAADRLAHCLPAAIRAHVMQGGGTSEHRPVTVAFLRYGGVDAMIGTRGPEATAAALARLVEVVDAAAESQDVALLASDVDADGGKLILCAGAPKVTGDDEERLLLALRRIVEADLPLPVRIGVHRGAVFAGDVGPDYRRTYTVMGDVVNLAARVMAKAQPGTILATADVLDRSNTLFETVELEPFAVKGKAEPVKAWSVGRAKGSRTQQAAGQRLPLTGRNTELGLIRKALGAVRSGTGQLIEVVGEPGIGKTRLLEAMRDAAMGYRKLRTTCEAYTSSTPYVVWRELLRDMLEIGRDVPDDDVEVSLRQAVATHAPDLEPWLTLLGAPFGLAIAPSPEVDMLAEANRRAKLHEVVGRFLEAALPGPAVIEIDDAHHMDEASVDLTAHLAGALAGRKWLIGVAHRPGTAGFAVPESEPATRIELKPLAQGDTLRMAQLATQEHPLSAHVIEVVAQRSGGHPQFLRDLLRAASASGGVVGLPDSAEAAALARIDGLAPEDRHVVRRAAVFGLNFHPRMLAWFDDPEDGPPPDDSTWARLGDLFDDDGDGYLRFRQSLLRDTAYEGLPFRQRRRLHAVVAAHVEQEMDDADEVAGMLSLHCLVAGEYAAAWRYACLAARGASDVYAHVEAAALYARALEAGSQMPDLPRAELMAVREALADAWGRAGEFRKASKACAEALQAVGTDRLAEAKLLHKYSLLEEKLGQYAEALRWVDRAIAVLESLEGVGPRRQLAHSTAWKATVLQAQGNTAEAIRWSESALRVAEAVDEPDAMGAAHFVHGWALGVLGKPGGDALLLKALEAYRRSGNRSRQVSTLNALGAVCQWEGRWDDAMGYYERGGAEALKVGDPVEAGVSKLNVGEILVDRGEVEAAEALLQQTMPLWRSSEYGYFRGACLCYLGRASLRGNRIDEALARFAEARGHLDHVGATQEIVEVDARVADCRLFKGAAESALAEADGILARTGVTEAVARMTPLLLRVRAHALILLGDPFAARDALEASIEAARGRGDLLEVATSQNSLVELDRLEGVEPAAEMLEEIREVVRRYKVRALPPIPAFG